jgi:hypothetical protein
MRSPKAAANRYKNGARDNGLRLGNSAAASSATLVQASKFELIINAETVRILGLEVPPYLVFGDIEGKLDVLRVECTKCPRKAVTASICTDNERLSTGLRGCTLGRRRELALGRKTGEVTHCLRGNLVPAALER